VAARVQSLLSTPRFRCYRTTDVTGVELGGALKNGRNVPAAVVYSSSLGASQLLQQCEQCTRLLALPSLRLVYYAALQHVSSSTLHACAVAVNNSRPGAAAPPSLKQSSGPIQPLCTEHICPAAVAAVPFLPNSTGYRMR
jgi:hypothetical protein